MVDVNGLRVFDGAVAIITGGASGIGRAMAEELARKGADVVLADVQSELAEEVARGIRAQGGRASAEGVDVTDFASVQKLVHMTFDEKGRLDFMFNNAGISLAGELKDYEMEDWDRVLDVNLRGVIHGVHAAYPVFIQQGFGHLVNTASITGLIGSPYLVGYSTSKYAVVGLSKALRVEAEQYGVRVSVLCPGFIDTPIMDGGPFGRKIRRLRDLPEPDAVPTPATFMPADAFAVQALKGIAKNRATIILPRKWYRLWRLDHIFPAFGDYVGRLILKEARKTNPNIPIEADIRSNPAETVSATE